MSALDEPRSLRRPISRRDALVAGGVSALGLALAACSSSTTGTTGSTGSTGSAGSRGSTGSPAGSTPATSAPSGTVPTVKLDAATIATLDAILDDGMKASGLPGVSIGVWIGGDEWRRSVGVADLTTKAPYQPGDKARIASITKTFTATAVLQLVDEGKLTLGDPLERYVPGITNGAQITIEHLLAMTSGIYDFTSNTEFVAQFDADPTMPWTLDQTIGLIKAGTPDFAPGAEVVYCDSNYVLLGMIAEQVAGQPLDQLIKTKIVDELGLAGTLYPTTATMATPHPTAYLPKVADPKKPYPFDNATEPPTVRNDVNPIIPAGAGAMISTVDDLRRWAEELAAGTLLSKETQAKRLATKTMSGQKIVGYGLGIMNVGPLVGHTGAVIGYNSFAMRYPAAGATFAAVANESTNFTTPTTDLILLPIIKALYPEALTQH